MLHCCTRHESRRRGFSIQQQSKRFQCKTSSSLTIIKKKKIKRNTYNRRIAYRRRQSWSIVKWMWNQERAQCTVFEKMNKGATKIPSNRFKRKKKKKWGGEVEKCKTTLIWIDMLIQLVRISNIQYPIYHKNHRSNAVTELS